MLRRLLSPRVSVSRFARSDANKGRGSVGKGKNSDPHYNSFREQSNFGPIFNSKISLQTIRDQNEKRRIIDLELRTPFKTFHDEARHLISKNQPFYNKEQTIDLNTQDDDNELLIDIENFKTWEYIKYLVRN